MINSAHTQLPTTAANSGARRLCVAPMMDWTDRHCRFFLRLISKHAYLYTEMITTGAILHGDADSFHLKPSDRRLQLLQRIRDEAHHQAISFHRTQKLKSDKKISLLAINGIGEAKMKRLIDYFGTFEAIEKAEKSELAHVLNDTDAEKIRAFFDQKD